MRSNFVKKSIIIETNNAVSKYKGWQISTILKHIEKDIQKILDGYISEQLLFADDFPIEFENDLGSWRIESSGNCYLLPKTELSHIEINITL